MLDRHLYKIIEQALGELFVKEYRESFSIRIIVQKVLYLLTHGNTNPKILLPYSWSFYLRGPYSSEIAHMLYHINDFWDELRNSTIELDEAEKTGIQYFKAFKRELDELRKIDREFQNISEEELYELLATLTDIAKQIGNDKFKLFEKLKLFKPDLIDKLTRSLLESIYSLLIQYGYL